MAKQTMRRWAATAMVGAAALAVGPGCGEQVPPAEPVALSGGLETLGGAVPAAALQEVAGVVHLVAGACSDLATDRAAAAATIRAARDVGLGPTDTRWTGASRSLTAGVADHERGTACAPRLSLWLGAGLAPVTIPTVAPATTTIPLAVQAAELAAQKAPKVSPTRYAKVRPGMTLGEVRKLFGSDGQTLASTEVGRHRDLLVRWPAVGKTFAGITVQFRDGRSLAKATTVGG